MSDVKYNIVSATEGSETVTAFINGEMYIANSDHRFYAEILNRLRNRDESVVDLFLPGMAVIREFTPLSDRVALMGGSLTFDGDVIHNALTEHILRMLDNGDDVTTLLLFWDKLAQNENEYSRDHLFRWLMASEFTLADNGNIVAYKGVERLEDGSYRSISSGTAFVDGKQHDGQIPNAIGSVVTMPRSEVMFDPDQTCSVGLHVGTWDYASGFAHGGVLTVEVNPRDVVSVPSDSSDQKMRVCRYVVTGVTPKEIPAPVVSGWFDYLGEEPEYEDDYEDYGDEDYDGGENFVMPDEPPPGW